LPETVNEQGIVASYEKGVLNITLPKKQEVIKETTRNIEVA
jgi:HSP20 family molecular chaperone IbpA